MTKSAAQQRATSPTLVKRKKAKRKMQKQSRKNNR